MIVKNSDEMFDNNITEGICDALNRTIYIYGDITNELAIEFSKHIRSLDKDLKDINILINSFGGYTHSCSSIVTDIMNCKSTVKTVCMGVAYSSAADILLAGDNRAISQFGLILFHMPSLPQGETSYRINDLESYINHVRSNLNELNKELLKGTKISSKKFIDNIKKGDWFVSPKEAKKLGIVHEII